MFREFAAAAGFHLPDGFNVSVAAGAACVTAMFLVTPPPVIVIVPLRWPPVFAVVLILNEPLPVRFAGVMFVTVSHDWLLLTFQVVLDVTFIVLFDAATGACHAAAGFTVRMVIPACVTVTVCVRAPALMVTVAVRAFVPVFANAVSASCCPDVPDVLFSASHD
jgi:hypothetical protein